MMARAQRGAKAWVLYWEKQPGGPIPIAEDGEVVAVLPPAWGKDRVCEVLERLYLERAASPAELVQCRQSGTFPYKPQCAAYLHRLPVADLAYICGHNPVLVARHVENLVVLGDDEIAWDEVGVAHTPALCELAGEGNCQLANQAPKVVRKRWRRS